MRVPVFCLVFLLPFCAVAQDTALYYFRLEDSSLIGVRTSSGKVVIPPIYRGYAAEPGPGDKVIGHDIVLFDTMASAADTMGYNYRMKVFDRNGVFLYSPYIFDNGPDYYIEGLRRFVAGGKMGFADPDGKKVIPANYNYIDPFYCGYALACADCRYTRFREGDEHCCGFAGTKYVLIDRKGNTVFKFRSGSGAALNDSFLSSLHLLPRYTIEERRLISKIEKVPEVHASLTGGRYKAIILEKPRQGHGFFLIAFRDVDGADDNGLCFLVNRDSSRIYHLNSNGEAESLEKWVKQ